MESYSPNLVAVVGYTKMLAELTFRIFNNITPSQTKGITLPITYIQLLAKGNYFSHRGSVG